MQILSKALTMIARDTEIAILLCYQQEKIFVSEIARRFAVHRDVVLRVVKQANVPDRSRPARRKRLDAVIPAMEELLALYPSISAAKLHAMMVERGYVGSSSHFRHIFVQYRQIGNTNTRKDTITNRRREWLDWLYIVERNQLPKLEGEKGLVRQNLVVHLKGAKRFERRKALALLANQQLFSISTISRCLAISINTVRGYISELEIGGVERVFERRQSQLKSSDEELKRAVFGLLHEPPSLSNINRTSWKMDDLQRVLAGRGQSACKEVIRKIIKDAGYKWRNARRVLTSNDPEYKEKVAELTSVLSTLRVDQKFFSIDEFGPFAIKITGGRTLVAPGSQPTFPQWQRTKGSLIVTAALELSSNQVTHFYSNSKNTAEIIRMTEVLVDQYQDARTLFLSWDAASWHISKELKHFISQHNMIAGCAELPLIRLLPLPSGAQFLNVIESLFSGMARAIIHNSNYASNSEAIAAIDRYLLERNLYFIENPKRAGNKIWGLERTNVTFDPSNNCKDPAYR